MTLVGILDLLPRNYKGLRDMDKFSTLKINYKGDVRIASYTTAL